MYFDQRDIKCYTIVGIFEEGNKTWLEKNTVL